MTPIFNEDLEVIFLSEEFWADEENYPEWLKDRLIELGQNRKHTDEEYEKGFLIRWPVIQELPPEKAILYEYEGWKPTLFIAYNTKGMYELTEDDVIAYSESENTIIMATKELLMDHYRFV